MITFLALLQLPPWVALSRVQRRFVWRRCVHPLLTRSPVMAAKTILAILSIVVAYEIGAFDSFERCLATIFVLIFVVPEILDLWLVTRHRGDVEAYIRAHGAEIQSVV